MREIGSIYQEVKKLKLQSIKGHPLIDTIFYKGDRDQLLAIKFVFDKFAILFDESSINDHLRIIVLHLNQVAYTLKMESVAIELISTLGVNNQNIDEVKAVGNLN